MSAYLLVAKMVDSQFALTNRPSFYIALVVMIIGMQLFLAGFIDELISRNSSSRNEYLIAVRLCMENLENLRES